MPPANMELAQRKSDGSFAVGPEQPDHASYVKVGPVVRVLRVVSLITPGSSVSRGLVWSPSPPGFGVRLRRFFYGARLSVSASPGVA